MFSAYYTYITLRTLQLQFLAVGSVIKEYGTWRSWGTRRATRLGAPSARTARFRPPSAQFRPSSARTARFRPPSAQFRPSSARTAWFRPPSATWATRLLRRILRRDRLLFELPVLLLVDTRLLRWASRSARTSRAAGTIWTSTALMSYTREYDQPIVHGHFFT